MENTNELKYNINVPYNHPSAVKSRKKMKIFASVMMFIVAPLWTAMAIGAFTGNNSSVAVAVLFIAMAVLCLICGIYFVYSIKPLKRDENRSIEFKFLDVSLEINQLKPNKKKTLTICLYQKYKNKQYVSQVVEYGDRFDVKIYTGTYNGIPRIAGYALPKDLVGENLDKFTAFLKERMGANYIVKNK